MLWKEFVEKTDCDCDVCPLKENDLCNGASVSCYGDEPVYAPCCDFEDDLDLDEYIKESFDNIRRYEEWEDKRIREERVKKEKAEKAAKTRKAADAYCYAEKAKIKTIEKQIKATQNAYDTIKTKATAYNLVNEMFGYPERCAEEIPEIESGLADLNEKLAEAKDRYKAKRKEFFASRKEK